MRRTIQIIRRHQQLQTQLRRYIHVRHVGLILVLLVVAEVLADFFEDDATVTIFPSVNTPTFSSSSQ